jgi:hypothetical protein
MCKPSLAQGVAKAFVVAWALVAPVSVAPVSVAPVSVAPVSVVRGAAAGCKGEALAENNTTSDMMPIVTSSISC